jgi:alpha-tubulin suppressor-like RCC1 family protein
VRADGTAWAWGDNAKGELGNGTTTPSSVPVPVPVRVSGLTGVVQVAAGYDSSLALRSHRFVAIGTPTPKVSLAAGNLPRGLKLAANGTLSGKPTRVGTYKFTLAATKGVGTPAKIVVSVKVVKG